jgi:amino acid adenylation domain-containing protein
MSHAVIEGFQLSAQQARSWRLQPQFPSLHAQIVVALDGPLDVASLDRAIRDVVTRHEIFRTTFRALPEMQMPIQVIEPDASFHITQVDAVRAGTAHATRIVADLAARDASMPWTFAEGPLLRGTLVARAAAQHTLILTLPAIAADHWTLTNLVHEIATDYAARIGRSRRADGNDADAPLQYVEFAEWQRELAEAEEAVEAQRFWQTAIAAQAAAAAPAALLHETPADSFERRTLVREFAPHRVRHIGMLTARHRTSEAAFWMTCWSLLMWRLSGRPDHIIGRVFHGRRYPEMQPAMGPIARCLPIRNRGEWTSSFAQLMVQVQQTMMQADGWQESYDQSARAADRGESAPNWPMMFEFYEWAATRPAGGVRFTTERQYCHGEPFIAKLTCFCGGFGLRTELHVDATRVTAPVAEWLFDQLHQLADSALADPHGAVANLDVLTDAQRSRLLGFNDTAAARPAMDRPLPWHFEAQVARTPDAAAVIDGESALTYTDVNRWANRIARDLRARGVGPESRVAVLMRRSPRLLAAFLGVLKAGGAYVPIDPGDASSRIAAVLEDVWADVILTDPETVLPAEASPRAMTVGEVPREGEEDRGNLPVSCGPDNLAYVIYTSGSTGTPKGALITHRGLMNYLLWCVDAYDVRQGEGAPLHSSVAFDLSVTSLFVPLLVGAPVTLAPERAPGEDLARVLGEARSFSFVKGTPAHLQVLTWQIPPATLGERTRAVILGGEALHANALRMWRDGAPGLRIFNEYGPTETVVGSCVYEVTELTAHPGAIPIGRPIANTQVYVLDRRGQLVPPGVEGELFIGGAGVARGYLYRPELTAERFVPDPFAPTPGARLYRTGDLVRWRTDGDLVYAGRFDDQVKLRGYRIELGEVEAALRELPGVRDVAALVREDAPGEKRLVAYLVGGQEAPRSPEDLRKALDTRLPDYMQPHAVVWLDALPLTRNGKVDRRALPGPDGHRGGGARQAMLTRAATPVEEVLSAIWADVLGLEEIGIDENFFALGGDSIRAIQVRARAAQRGLTLTHEQLFEHQTIASLARVVELDHAPAPPSEPLPPFALTPEEDRSRLPEGVEDAYPIAALQAGMIFHSEYAPESAIFHDLHSFTLKAPVDLDTMRRGLREVMVRHATLRTGFELSRYSRPLQLVYRDIEPPLEFTDLRDRAPEEQQAALETWLREERQRTFDWRRAPLLRFHVHQLGDEHYQFTLSFHHAVLDGWSAASLLTELFNRARVLQEQPDAPAAPPLTCTFRDFVALEQQAEQSETCQQFWRDQLNAAPAVRLPRSGATGTSGDGVGLVQVPIPTEVIDGLRRFTRAAALPIKSVALAVHAKALSVETNQSAIVTGLVSHGRPEVQDGDRVLGLFLNTVPCVMRVGAGRWRELVQDAFECERRLIPFRRYPLARLQREHGGPLFDVGFNFMHFHVYQGVQQSESMQVEGYTGYEETDLPLTANFLVEPISGNMRLSLNYRRSEFSQEQVERIGRRYALALAALAADPESYHAATDLLTPTEREQVVETWARQVSDEEPTTESIVPWLEAQAARTPEAIAVTLGDESFTYRELHARANQLAWHLRGMGVGPETLVSICVERSPELLVGILGILKAGGAYVPLDPGNPEARLALVLGDARPKVLLTRESLASQLPPHDAVTVCLDADWPSIERQSTEDLPQLATASNLAYVIYTSGSTGTPKGTLIAHGGLRNYLTWAMDAYSVTEGDGAPLHSSVAFDLSVTSIFIPLLSGGPVTLIPELAAGELARLLADERRYSFIKLTPAHLQALALQVPPDSLRARTQTVIVGGEALHTEALRVWWDAAPDVRIYNEYGPTETVVGSSVFEAAAAGPGGAVPIGRPIANTQLYVLDRFGQPVPPGVEGELFIGGRGVARGYLHRPDLTADRFVPDGFGSIPGARLYRTGDIARWREDGNLEYVGRRDQQVKIRGYRVEIGEIEAALRQQAGVREAVALMREDVPGDRRLVAYVVADSITADGLQQALRTSVPDYMVPAALVWLDALPLTANGKVDRGRLPVPSGERPALVQEYTAPRTPDEETLARIWSEVLRLDRVGIHDNFFALGGHSLTAMQVIARVRDAFAIELPLRPLFESPTIAAVARLIEEERIAPSLQESAAMAPIPAVESANVDSLLDELDSMSGDEVRALLGEQA